MTRAQKTIFALAVFLSGCGGLIDQIVWLRFAFIRFGALTPVLSMFLSAFMLGLAFGSWAGPKLLSPNSSAAQELLLYSIAELLVGIGALATPLLFVGGEALLLHFDTMNSPHYFAATGLLILLSVAPWTFCMGATIPLLLKALRDFAGAENHFSFLYRWNVLGAVTGTFLAATLLIETFGFHRTLCLAAVLNSLAAALAFSQRKKIGLGPLPQKTEPSSQPERRFRPAVLWIVLFITGFTSMALEVLWTRAFTIVLGTTVYAFSFILSVYLASTFAGTTFYRRSPSADRSGRLADSFGIVVASVLLPLFLSDAHFGRHAWLLLAGIVPFCFALGYLTPQCIDIYSGGDARKAGNLYAVNVFGSLLGPLFAGYVLLVHLGLRESMIALAFALFIVWLPLTSWRLIRHWVMGITGISLIFLCASWVLTYEDRPKTDDGPWLVRRDYAATVVSSGTGLGRRLSANGIDVAPMSINNKLQAHLPALFVPYAPQRMLTICFGMGTTFRSLTRWGGQTTAVDLIPSLQQSYSFYFLDAKETLARGMILTDDGRRFLKRTQERFDVITVDPPQPAETAGLGMLYSQEFFQLAKSRMTNDGVFQIWFRSWGDPQIIGSLARSLHQTFPFIRVYSSIGGWGYHFLASSSPLPSYTAQALGGRLPPAARDDLTEWNRDQTPEDILAAIVGQEVPITWFLSGSAHALTDDRPSNEYYLLHQTIERIRRKFVGSHVSRL